MRAPIRMVEELAGDRRVAVLVADGSDRLRRQVTDLLARDRRFVVVGGVGVPSDLPRACVELEPDVLVLGLGEKGDGSYLLSALSELRSAARGVPSMTTLVLIPDGQPAWVVAAVRANVRGVLLRDVDEGLLRHAALAAMSGRHVLDPRLTDAIFDYMAGRDDNGRSLEVDPAVRTALSPREQEVLISLAQGRRNEEIALALGVSVGTVKTHLRHIYRKMDVDDRLSAVLKAFQLHVAEVV